MVKVSPNLLRIDFKWSSAKSFFISMCEERKRERECHKDGEKWSKTDRMASNQPSLNYRITQVLSSIFQKQLARIFEGKFKTSNDVIISFIYHIVVYE